MRQVRVGDRVRAFLDANMAGEVTEIFHTPAPAGILMYGGVPPKIAYARVRKSNGEIVTIKTTELSHLL